MSKDKNSPYYCLSLQCHDESGTVGERVFVLLPEEVVNGPFDLAMSRGFQPAIRLMLERMARMGRASRHHLKSAYPFIADAVNCPWCGATRGRWNKLYSSKTDRVLVTCNGCEKSWEDAGHTYDR